MTRPGDGKALRDHEARHVDEIVEGVGALVELAVEIPLIAEIVAAADMGDGIGKAAIEQRQPVGREAGRHRVAVGAIGIDVQPAGCRPF